jgi:hypothetical protein
LASLNASGIIPSAQLPSYVDDVIEVDTFSNLPGTGESGKIYIVQDTNLTYRWSGTDYVEISKSLALGETSSTAYPGDKGKATTDKVNAHVADFENPHQVTKEQIGLGNVDNTSDADKPISSAVQEALDAVNKEVSEHKADKNNPHEVTKAQVGLGNVDNTADLDKPVSNATQELVDNTKKELDTKIDNHTSDFNNPHKVTKEQVGLGNVDNTADINKPVSVAQQNALDTLSNSLNTAINNHVGNTNNPHQVTKEQVGLDQVDNTSDANKPISTATQTALNGKFSATDGNALKQTIEDMPDLVVTEGRVSHNNNNISLSLRQQNLKDPVDTDSILLTFNPATDSTAGIILPSDKVKVDKIVTDGDGTKYLSDNGTYKEVQGGSEDLLPDWHSIKNVLSNGNEFNFADGEVGEWVWLNYRSRSGNTVSAGKLYIGDGQATGGFAEVHASGFFKESDVRLKSNIAPLNHTLDQICNIPTVEFDMHDKHQIGTVA